MEDAAAGEFLVACFGPLAHFRVGHTNTAAIVETTTMLLGGIPGRNTLYVYNILYWRVATN